MCHPLVSYGSPLFIPYIHLKPTFLIARETSLLDIIDIALHLVF